MVVILKLTNMTSIVSISLVFANPKQMQTRADQADKMYKYPKADLFKALKMRSDY